MVSNAVLEMANNTKQYIATKYFFIAVFIEYSC